MKRKIETRMVNGKYGIADAATEQIIIPVEYENIFKLNPLSDSDLRFVLYKSGKVGAVFINDDNSCEWIAPCEYNYFQGNWNLFFYNASEVRCYFYETKNCKMFSRIRTIDFFSEISFCRK